MKPSKAEGNDFIGKFGNEQWRRTQLRWTFVYSEKFSSIRELIEIKFEPFFQKLISSSPNKKELDENNPVLREAFYTQVYRRIETDVYLMNTLEFIANSKKKIKATKSKA